MADDRRHRQRSESLVLLSHTPDVDLIQEWLREKSAMEEKRTEPEREPPKVGRRG